MTGGIYLIREGRIFPHYAGPADHPWLAALVAEYERFAGRPRRILAERLSEPLPCPSPPGLACVAREVLDRTIETREAAAVPPRAARRELFLARARQGGAAAEVMASVAGRFGVDQAALSASLFADVADERLTGPVPDDLHLPDLVARINLALVQRLLRRAIDLRIRLEARAHPIVRHARWRGLICSVRTDRAAPGPVLEISGPLSILRRTTVYGRALAELAAILPWCGRYALLARCELHGRELMFELNPGDALLPVVEPRRFDSRVEERFARDFARAAPDWLIVREPEPVAAEGTLIFPDFALVHRRDPARRWLLEIVGYWTPEYLAQKLRRLRSAAAPCLVLCVDQRLSVSVDELPSATRLVPFTRRVDPAAVLGVIDGDGRPRMHRGRQEDAKPPA